VFNISQTARLIHTFQTGAYENLNDAMQDKLHQNYRFPILPGAQPAIQASINAGAYGACLSGAGPGVIAFSTDVISDTISHAIEKAYGEFSIKAETFTSKCPSRGAFIS